MNNSRKYLFLDIDGTIAENSKPPSKITIEAIRKLRKYGHKVFICTARTMCDIYQSLYDVGFDGIVSGAGAQVIIEEKEIYHNYIPEITLIKTVKGFYQHSFSGVLEGTDNIYFVPGEVELIGDWPCLQGIEQVSADLKIEKFTIHTFNHEHIKIVLQQMPQLLEWYDVYDNNSGSFVEFVCKGIDKAFGIQKVLDYYSASRKNAIAIGDSMNDAPAIISAGIGIAMGNAPKVLRDKATFVTGTLAEEGVASALQKLGFI